MRRVLAVLLVLISSFGLLGCAQVPRIDVAPSVDNGQVVFDIPRSGVNGILAFHVCDESGTALWSIRTSYEKGQRITYGVLPNGGNMEALQSFPLEDQPLCDIRGKTVTVSVVYQYDSGFVPCSGTLRKTVVVP